MGVKFKGSCLTQEGISFNYGKTGNIYIVDEKNKNFNIDSYPTLKKILFVAVQMF